MNTKLLAALTRLMFSRIPSDPLHKDYRQGGTLGAGNTHWFRAKFGNGRFRLFFRCSSKHRTIIFAWVNDENSLRTYGSKTDAYAVVQAMLESGNPPDDGEAQYLTQGMGVRQSLARHSSAATRLEAL